MENKSLGQHWFSLLSSVHERSDVNAVRRILEFNSHSPLTSQEMGTNPNMGYHEAPGNSVQCEMAAFAELPVTSQSTFLALPWDSQAMPILLSLVSSRLYSSSKPAHLSADPESFPFRTR